MAISAGRFCEYAGLVSTVASKIFDRDGVLPKNIL
jgi:hypothetical protein